MDGKLFIESIRKELESNSNKISPKFIDNIALESNIIHIKPTENTRIAIIQLPTGHEVIGYAQVLDAKNDIEEIGKSVAFENAKNELWKLVGSIAKNFI